jgi:hypothetical protein
VSNDQSSASSQPIDSAVRPVPRRLWVADPGRHWGIRLDQHIGPWISLGLHIDLGSPLVDLHIGWWLVSIGRIYRGGRLVIAHD